MPLDVAKTRRHLKEFSFKDLFVNELGWDHCSSRLEVTVDDQEYTLHAIAEKRGMVAFSCTPADSVEVPNYAIRRKIEKQVSKSVREHIIIYADAAKKTQIWQWVKREAGKPTACREHAYHINQPGDSLIQKLQSVAFSLDEEEQLTIVHVAGRAKAAFDVERITKKFYDRFKAEHDAFLKFIEGIPDDELHRWYVSVMLNRLMFIYFIQKKGFLASDENYLRTRLLQSKAQGHDRFYKGFLCPLFFEGFAKKEKDRSPAINKLLGAIPYLNGGLFLKHQIEELHGKHIEISDKAFEKLFDFFDQYQWHLDERPLRKDNEINPDVLGYIFEKYINQKQMGAYYTKEDITEYISKNTVIPFLFDAAKEKCKIAFVGAQFIAPSRNPTAEEPGAMNHAPTGNNDATAGVMNHTPTVWQLLQNDPDRYCYPAVMKGVELSLPPEIAAGIRDVAKRTEWNKPASAEYALPTEIWREVVARRQRYEEVKAKMLSGGIQSINDLITYNLDIRQFAQDVIWNSEGPELLRAFYHAIENVTVLDPTCGSGAFLFAALNILEPLYEACLDRMQVFVDELARSEEKHRPEKYSDFRKILNRVSEHPNLKYFIFKSIIVNNLYGVDIMEEAIEICKLRLFLKLVAQIDDVSHIEPLPDIDFNIRAGNSLVGFATYEELKQTLQSDLVSLQSLPAIEEKAQEIDRLFRLFHQQQTELGGEVTPEDKQELRARLKALEDELNSHLANEYVVDSKKKNAYDKWLKSHQPFHWFVEFYRISKKGGFDVIIGNPPYVEYSKVRDTYKLLPIYSKYSTNLYAACCFRGQHLLNPCGYSSFIVPVALPSTDRMEALRKVLSERCSIYHTSFSTRPSKLFEGAEQRLTIYIQVPSVHPRVFSGGFLKWGKAEREILFPCIHYIELPKNQCRNDIWIKATGKLNQDVLTKLLSFPPLSRSQMFGSGASLYYKNTGLRYFNTVTLRPPKCWINGTATSSSRETVLEVMAQYRNAVHSILLSSAFFVYWQAMSNCRDLNPSDISNFSVPDITDSIDKLNALSTRIEEDYVSKGTVIRMNNRLTGLVELESLTPAKSKPLIDEIDRVLAKHYGFTDEELDFIINYDIKYRMGREGEEE